MASKQKVQEDKNIQILRELVKLPCNRHCFDCNQRGPTYVNITIGSFVCTSCSGILRGLNPPHRVKSITMTTFTPEEIDFIKQKGNQYCWYAWLGTYNTRINKDHEVTDEQHIKDFMIQKYERKRWYVDMETGYKQMHQEQQQGSNTQIQKPEKQGIRALVSQISIPETKPLSTLLGETAAPLVIQNNKQDNSDWGFSLMNTSSSQQAATQQSQGRTRNGAYGISGKDPFGRKTAVNSNELASPNGNFANFENSFSSVPAATTQDAGQFAAQNFTPFQSSSSKGYFSSPTKQTINHQISDKYAALASVNNLFPQPSLPVTTSGSVWSVAGTVFGTSPATGSVYGTAASNPFSSDTAPTWSQPASGRCESQKFFPAANPFQGALPPPGFSAFAQTAAFDVQVPTQSINHFDQCEILASGSPNKVDFGVFTESITPNTTFQVIPGSSGMVKPSIDMSKKQFGIKNEGFNMGGTATGWPVTGINPNGDQSSGVTWNFRSGQQAQRSIFPDNKFENWPKEQFIQSSGNPFSVSSGPTQPVKLNPGNPFL